MAELDAVHRYLATVTLWNRLEGRPRAEDFDRALRAEVRDPLWMISRQWQMGEFIGDDAGSPVLAKVHMETSALTRYRGGDGPAVDFENDVPLEVKVEHQSIPFTQAGQSISLDIRLLMGRHWLKLVRGVAPDLPAAYVGAYGFEEPDPASETDAPICAHADVWQHASAISERGMDGYALYAYLKGDDTRHAYDGIAEVDSSAKEDAIDALANKFVAWFEKLFYQPGAEPNASWRPEYLEYQFATSAPKGSGERVFAADEYYHGHLDWYNLDISHDGPLGSGGTGEPGEPDGDTPEDGVSGSGEGSITHTFVPTSVTFGGMPHPRWWTFESWRTNLGFVKPDTTDLNKLLLLDFFLTYSNDWFVVPFTLPVGSVADVRGLLVTNVFGEKVWIEPAGRGPDEAWQRWSMYTHAVAGTENVPAELTALVLPVSRKVQEGRPLEEVYLLRDEVANMVWGAETRVPVASGQGYPGREAAHELRAKLQQLVLDGGASGGPGPEPTAPIRYRIVNSVPEHWIPFIPVHIEGQNREIQLQRASLPRILEGDDRVPRKIEPRTSLLREGLEGSPKSPYFLHEEEVSRAGIRVRKAFQRTRWHGGRVFTWLGTHKEVGRGEGRSGLAFDELVPVTPAEAGTDTE